jgi:uncharacterized ubiquitin-like protein YukD
MTEQVKTETTTAEIPVTIVLPSGGSRSADVPRDVPVRELIPELTTSLQLPTTGPDGRPTSYRLDSKALGRELREDETLASAGIPDGDRLMLTADVTAGACCACCA